MEIAQQPDMAAVTGLAEPGETVEQVTETLDAQLVVTDQRIRVASGDRVALDVPFHGLRRIQFDIERNRPATLVIVPDDPQHEPQVLAIPRGRYDEVTSMLARIGHRIADGHDGS
jgi:hypothetical protein